MGQASGELTAGPPREGHRWAAISQINARELTWLGGGMLLAGAVLSALPGHPGLPCPLRALTGVPCPLCGMTTSVEATMRLDLGDALVATPAGLVAVVVAVVLLVRRPATLPLSLPVGVGLLGAMWLFQLHRFGFV